MESLVESCTCARRMEKFGRLVEVVEAVGYLEKWVGAAVLGGKWQADFGVLRKKKAMVSDMSYDLHALFHCQLCMEANERTGSFNKTWLSLTRFYAYKKLQHSLHVLCCIW